MYPKPLHVPFRQFDSNLETVYMMTVYMHARERPSPPYVYSMHVPEAIARAVP